jgi:hypothetical protein
VSGRSTIEAVSDAVRVARALRYEDPSTFDDLTPEELDVVARGLRAVSYSCIEGARKLERILTVRRGHEHRVPSADRTVPEILADPAVPEGTIEVRDGDRVLARIVDVEVPE